jgi:hypothetical protein
VVAFLDLDEDRGAGALDRVRPARQDRDLVPFDVA